jgi:hypothetical protein
VAGFEKVLQAGGMRDKSCLHGGSSSRERE